MKYTLSLFSNSANPAHNKIITKVEALTWDELSARTTTINWSPAVYQSNTRNLANYGSHPSLFAFDIDGGMTIEEAKIAFKDYQCLIQTSRNHQKVKNAGTPSEKAACDRFRVIFPLAEPITSDADFKATWEAYADNYPLDPQTKSSSMYFFKSTQTVFNNPTGKPLPVVKADEWSEVKNSTYSFTKEEGKAKGKISAMSQAFLESGAPAGMFNARLFKCAVDHLEQKYSEAEFLELCSQAAGRGAFQPLDSQDLATVKSAFAREPKYGLRVAGSSFVDSQKKDIVSRIMDGVFLQCVMAGDTIWYKITDYENQEVENFSNEQILDRHIYAEIQKPENYYVTTKRVTGADGKLTTQNHTQQMTLRDVKERWGLAGDALTELVEPVLWRNEEGWCHKRINLELAAGAAHPAWDEFLTRLSDPELFKAWVFGCFISRNHSRQALWLHGKNGQDGKSKVIEAITDYFGAASATLSGASIRADSRFGLSQFIGKRIAGYPDCKYTRFPLTELFRNLTGGDAAAIELKGGGFLSQKLRIKVIVGSNYEPITSAANYDQSRLIIIDVAPSKVTNDPDWGERLKSELPAFLGDAQRAYQRLCSNHGDFEVGSGVRDRLADIGLANEVLEAALFEEFFRVDHDADPSQFVRGNELVRVFQAKREQKIQSAIITFKTYLDTRHNIQWKRDKTGVFYSGLVFKDQKTGDAYRLTLF